MNLSQEQVARFYETLALLIAQKKGVNIKVVVLAKKEVKDTKQGEEAEKTVKTA